MLRAFIVINFQLLLLQSCPRSMILPRICAINVTLENIRKAGIRYAD